ncbi:VTC domain-containing protein [Streptomyces sp. Ncost-T10-10d]|nr:VTC domain-containing protein [Streptomyces sp. Ncost-T10-10d]
MEIKVNEHTPHWITDLAARRSLSLVRISKYVQSIEAFGLAPRSVFHVNEADYPPPTPNEEQPLQQRPTQHDASLTA